LEKKYGEPVLEEYEWSKKEEKSDGKVVQDDEHDDLDEEESIDPSNSEEPDL
jgi:hypothetical protein